MQRRRRVANHGDRIDARVGMGWGTVKITLDLVLRARGMRSAIMEAF